MDEFKKSLGKISKLIEARQFRPYINYIRFPYFKNIQQDTKIQFDFPFTVLVGKNGCGKSSVLHSLYGAPENKSVGEFWFSTHLDPIKEDNIDRNRVIHGFYSIDAKRNVEVIKSRVQFKKQGGTYVNPDNWETSRPLKGDNMEEMPPIPAGIKKLPGRTTTRWKAIKKNVEYMDFRSELSSFDKVFYFHDLTNSHQKKQDYLRDKSKPLKHIIDNKLSSHLYFRKQRIKKNREFTKDELKAISIILEKDYQNGRYIEHSFFKSEGYSVIFTTDKIQYSEAFAGSGESIIARLVVKVLNAPEHSLILLDEPEVSLHPAAQKKLREFLLGEIIKKKHQVIIATHSPIFVEGLPKEAVKLFYSHPITGKFEVQNETYPAEAFHHLGSLLHSKKTIIVEDKLAQKIVEKALKLIGKIHQDYDVEYYPGGATALIGSYIPYHSIQKDKNVWFILDGDQKPIKEHIDPGTIPPNNHENLSELIKNQVGQYIKFNQDSNNPKQIIDIQLQFLRFYKNRVFYLSAETPEKFIWDNVDFLKKREEKPKCYKQAFEGYTLDDLGAEDVNSEQIFVLQQSMLAKVPDDCDDMKNLIKTLEFIVKNSVS